MSWGKLVMSFGGEREVGLPVGDEARCSPLLRLGGEVAIVF